MISIVVLASFVAESTIGIDQNILEEPGLSIYPNPASDQIMLEVKAVDRADLVFTLVDMSGRRVLLKELGSVASGPNLFTVSLDGLEDGIYTCVISDGSGISRHSDGNDIIATRRIVISR